MEARDRKGSLICTRKVAEDLCGLARAERHLCTERLAARAAHLMREAISGHQRQSDEGALARAAHQLHVKEATR